MSKDEITRTVDELAGKVERDNVTEADITAAQRLARKHLYAGHEPYSPAIYSIAAMLAEHRREIEESRRKDFELIRKREDDAVTELDEALAKLAETEEERVALQARFNDYQHTASQERIQYLQMREERDALREALDIVLNPAKEAT